MQCRIEPETNPCCLIVEDSERDQQMLRRAVRYAQRDIRVQIANTLKDARRALIKLPVSLILMENTLPDGRGVELALELSQHARFRCIPVIIATDWPSPFMWHKAKQAGVRHVVAKADFGPALIRDVLNIGREYG
ncbi:response regulator [Sedimentitalea todarodis]|uniref:Response regulator n=1 Tax=Sedimentitalea todarodis TaxID=1631240 RepID=A0ABU3VG89_9RHOB|nr:response regulator [Sedimentitalea todarodis]MDU9005212.1 response regulator [Sedimentitalea todarodis]